MTQREPAPFQRDALKTLMAAMLKCKGVTPTAQWIDGQKESYWRVSCGCEYASAFEAYIYNDEAGIMRHGDEWTAFERPDYGSADDLIAAFVSTCVNCTNLG